MAEVTGVSIDVDLDIGPAQAKIGTLKSELEGLSETVNVDVDVHRDQLDTLREDLDGLNDVKKKVKVEREVVGDAPIGDEDSSVKKTVKNSTGADKPDASEITKADEDPDADRLFNFGQEEGTEGPRFVESPDDGDDGRDRSKSFKELIRPSTLEIVNEFERDNGPFTPASPKQARKKFTPTDTDIIEVVERRKERDAKPSPKSPVSDVRRNKRGRNALLDSVRQTRELMQSLELPAQRREERGNLRNLMKGLDLPSRRKQPPKFVLSEDVDGKIRRDVRVVGSSGGDGGDGGDGGRRGFGGFFDGDRDGSLLRKLMPTMQKWWQLIGVLLPLVISLAGAVGGLAAAFGSAAVAGAGLIGLGLIGHGDDMASAMQNAKKEVDELKKGLFEVFQQPAKKFSDIQGQIFDNLPGESEKLAESIEGLTAFEDLTKTGIRGIIDLFTRLIDTAVEFDGAIAQVSKRFGSILADNIVGLFEALIVEVKNNQGLLIKFGKTFKYIIIIIYNLSKVFSGLLSAFNPVLKVFVWFTQLLQNKFIKSLVVSITTFLLLAKATWVTVNAFGALVTMIKALQWRSAITSALGFISTLKTAVVSANSLTGALHNLRGAITGVMAATGIGLLLSAGGAIYAGMQTSAAISDTGTKPGNAVEKYGSAGGQNTVINNEFNVSGNAGRKEVEKMRDAAQKEIGVDKETQRP